MNETAAAPQQAESTGLLLGIGGLIVAGIAVAWLLIYKPWQGEPVAAPGSPPAASAEVVEAAPAASQAQDAASLSDGPRGEVDVSFGNPLRMAQLALDAGMLVEPENYSAWSLFLKARNDNPDSGEAQSGLEQVAEVLVERAGTAIDQGRTADAQKLVSLVLSALPDHPGAQLLQDDLPGLRTESLVDLRPTVAAEAQRPVVAPAPRIARTQPPARTPQQPQRSEQVTQDPFKTAETQFAAALGASKLLAPADSNAKRHLAEMIELGPERDATSAARSALFDQLLRRADVAVDAMDTDAAETWLAEARALDFDNRRVENVRERLIDRLVEVEAAQPVPVSELIVENYKPPRYPRRALDRNLEGWVDLEFVVDRTGKTREVLVLDASHERYFREEAISAAESWVFQPREIRGRIVDQRVFSRLTFKLE